MVKLILTVAFVIVFFNHLSESWVIPDLEKAFSEIQQQFVHGGGKAHDSAHSSERGEKGEKSYSAQDEEEKGAKGHHDKERHQGGYAEQAGDKKSHHHDDGYYAEQHKGDKGAKGYNYEEEGSYAKGHNIKGAHKVHTLDEFKKNTEFYDEDHDEAHKEKHGGYEHKFDSKFGGANKGGHFKKLFLEGNYGKSGEVEGGSHYDEDKGHEKAAGHKEYYADQEKSEKERGNGDFKLWGYRH